MKLIPLLLISITFFQYNLIQSLVLRNQHLHLSFPHFLQSDISTKFTVDNLFIINENPNSPQLSFLNCSIIFSQKQILIETTNNNKISIPHKEFLFWDGFSIFDSFNHAESIINTNEYKQIFSKFKPLLIQNSLSYNKQTYNDNCALSFREFFLDQNQPTFPKTNQAFVFCIVSPDSKLSFIKTFKEKYTYYILNKENLLDMQLFSQSQHVLLKVYDPLLESSELENPPLLYTSFQHDGIIMQKNPSLDPTNISFSFRYDQIIDCNGVKDKDKFYNALPPLIKQNYPKKECCIGLEVEWQNKGEVDMFCSIFPFGNKCEVDIKIFRASLFRQCIKSRVDYLYDVYVKNNKSFKNVNYEQMEIIEKMKLIIMAKQIKEWEIEMFIYDDMDLKNKIRELKMKVDDGILKISKSIAVNVENREKEGTHTKKGTENDNKIDGKISNGTGEWLDNAEGIMESYIKEYGEPKDKENSNNAKNNKSDKDKDLSNGDLKENLNNSTNLLNDNDFLDNKMKSLKNKDTEKHHEIIDSESPEIKSHNQEKKNKLKSSLNKKKKSKNKKETHKKSKKDSFSDQDKNEKNSNILSYSNSNKDEIKNLSSAQKIQNPIEYTNEEWGPIQFAKDGITLVSPSGLILPVHVHTDSTTLIGPTNHVLPYTLSKDQTYFIGPDCEPVPIYKYPNGLKRPWLTLGSNNRIIGADGKILLEENLLPS